MVAHTRCSRCGCPPCAAFWELEWTMKSAPPWAKIWWDWYTTRSHVGVSGVGLAMGPILMLLCKAEQSRSLDRHSDANSDVTIWARNADGTPVSVQELAQISRFGKGAIKRGLSQLVAVGTLVVSADGCYGFPKFQSYQETSQAARMRRHRERQSAVTVTPRGERREERKKIINNGSDQGGGDHQSEWFSTDTVANIFSELRKAAGGKTFQHNPRDYTQLEGAVNWGNAEAAGEEETPEQIIRESIAYFIANAKAAANGWPFNWWANDPGSWVGPIAAPKKEFKQPDTPEEAYLASQAANEK